MRFVPSPRRTPFTFWYLVMLLGTTVIVRTAPRLSSRLMDISSTNAYNLEHHPVLCLVASAFWLADVHWAVWSIIFALAIAPLERQIGSGRTILVFVSGHVLATLATEIPVLIAFKSHVLPREVAHWQDIGVSYGLLACAGASLYLLEKRLRPWAALGIFALATAAYLIDNPSHLDSIMTYVGHLIAFAIGALAWRSFMLRRTAPSSNAVRPAPNQSELRPQNRAL